MKLNHLAFTILAAVVSIFTCGCTQHWNLKISEVGKDKIELFLDEDASKSLTLGDIELHFKSSSGTYRLIRLGALGRRLHGGEFMMIWEQGSYHAQPTHEDFSGGQNGSVPGIKVANNYLDDAGTLPCEIVVTGSNTRYIFPFFFVIDRISDDIMKFGQPQSDRPNTFTGGFQENGTLGSPTGSLSLQRKWNGSHPRDTDNENDWKQGLNNWGVPTP